MKKLLSILLVLLLCTGLLAMTASAAGEGDLVDITVSSHELKEGTDTVTVTVTMTRNESIGAMAINFAYDTDVLELTDLKWHQDADKGFTWSAKQPTGGTYVNADSSTYTGKLVELTFKVLKTDLYGQSTTVTVNYDATTVDYIRDNSAASGTIKFLCTHDYEVTATTAGDCVTKGTETYTCSKCDDSYVKETVLGDHGELVETTVPATCTEDGKTEKTCPICEKVIETIVLERTGHNYELTSTTASKCGEAGTNTYTCANCGDTYSEEIAALEHLWDEGAVTTEPTCTEVGVKTYKCTREGCDGTKTEEVAALGHTEADAVEENVVDPTCTVAGSKDVVVYCSVCDEELSRKTETIAALGHDWDEGVVTKEPTCTEKGEKTHTCNNDCGETKTAEIECVPHTFGEALEEHATQCHYTCAVCGEEQKQSHTCDTWTQNDKGEWVGNCTFCGQQVNRGDLIPAGDITPMLVMGGVAVFSMLAAAAYVSYRKFAK